MTEIAIAHKVRCPILSAGVNRYDYCALLMRSA